MNRSTRLIRPRGKKAFLLDPLESRTLLSVSMFGGDSNSDQGGTEVHHHGFIATTPIADLTGNPLTFTQVVNLPAVQIPDADHLLPAVQDIATLTSSTTPVKLRGYSV